MNTPISNTAKQSNIATISAFSLTALIYLTNAAYTYFYIDDWTGNHPVMNISLGIMFFCIGLSFINYKSK